MSSNHQHTSSVAAINEIIEEYVNCTWEQLPNDVKEVLGGNKQMFEKILKDYSMERQLPFEQSPVQHFMNRKDYYNDMIEHLRNNLRVSCS